MTEAPNNNPFDNSLRVVSFAPDLLDSWWEHFDTLATSHHGSGQTSVSLRGVHLRLDHSAVGRMNGFHCECGQIHLFAHNTDQIEVLSSIAAEAVSASQAEHTQFEWSGFLTVYQGPLGSRLAIAETVSLPGLTISPRGVVIETKSQFRPSPGSTPTQVGVVPDGPGSTTSSTSNAFELLVRGIETQPSWASTERLAGETLRRVANLMSVLHHTDVHLTSIPQRIRNTDQSLPHPELSNSPSLPDDFRPAPTTELSDAWEALRSHDATLNAVGMLAESISLYRTHPSLSHFASVSAIEAIGQDLIPATECAGVDGNAGLHCSHCMKKKGAMRAFATAIETIRPPHIATQMKKTAYRMRSETGHSAVLHGGEGEVHPPFSFLPTSNRREFDMLRTQTHLLAVELVKKALSPAAL